MILPSRLGIEVQDMAYQSKHYLGRWYYGSVKHTFFFKIYFGVKHEDSTTHFMCKCMYMYVSLYMYIHISIYTYINIYKHIQIHCNYYTYGMIYVLHLECLCLISYYTLWYNIAWYIWFESDWIWIKQTICHRMG